MQWTVDVGFTTQRPVKPEQHTSRVHVLAEDAYEAEILALLMVESRPGVVMATSSQILV